MPRFVIRVVGFDDLYRLVEYKYVDAAGESEWCYILHVAKGYFRYLVVTVVNYVAGSLR